MRPPRGPSARPLSRAQSALRPGPPPWRWPARPRRWRAGPLRYAAGRVQAGPVLARPGRPRPIAAARPCPAPARAPSPPLVWAGGWRRGARPVVGLRPVSLLAAWVRGAAAPPPGRSAVGAVARSLAAAALAWGWRPCLRPCRRLRLTRPTPAGTPQRPGGGVGAGAGPRPRPVVLLGAGPGRRSGGQRPPGPAPFPTPGRGGTMPPGRRGFGVLPPAGGAPPAGCGPPPPHEGGWGLDSAACGRRGTWGGGNRRPKIIFPTNAAPRRHRDIGNSCASYS